MRVWINTVSEDEASGPAYRPVRLAKKSTQAQDGMTDGNAHGRAGSRNRRSAVVLALFLLQLAGTAHAVQVHKWTGAGHAHPSAGVTDGDTLRILYKGGELKVRLAGIDAPRAAPDLRAKGEGDAVGPGVWPDGAGGRGGPRPLGACGGRVYRGDLDVNAEMVRQGMAWVYRKYTHDRELYRIEDDA
jgi:endonuclease YncB( thermonuclease family)